MLVTQVFVDVALTLLSFTMVRKISLFFLFLIVDTNVRNIAQNDTGHSGKYNFANENE